MTAEKPESRRRHPALPQRPAWASDISYLSVSYGLQIINPNPLLRLILFS